MNTDVIEPPHLDERTLCATTAHLLSATARCAGGLGVACALMAVALLALNRSAGPAALLALALVPVERVLALRLHFDAGLFRELAREAQDGRPQLASLDQALQRLRLRKPSALPRPLEDRIEGSRRLVAWHVAVAAVQGVAVLAAVTLTRGAAT